MLNPIVNSCPHEFVEWEETRRTTKEVDKTRFCKLCWKIEKKTEQLK